MVLWAASRSVFGGCVTETLIDVGLAVRGNGGSVGRSVLIRAVCRRRSPAFLWVANPFTLDGNVIPISCWCNAPSSGSHVKDRGVRSLLR